MAVCTALRSFLGSRSNVIRIAYRYVNPQQLAPVLSGMFRICPQSYFALRWIYLFEQLIHLLFLVSRSTRSNFYSCSGLLKNKKKSFNKWIILRYDFKMVRKTVFYIVKAIILTLSWLFIEYVRQELFLTFLLSISLYPCMNNLTFFWIYELSINYK